MGWRTHLDQATDRKGTSRLWWYSRPGRPMSGLAWVMVSFAIIAIVLVAVFLPETKGPSVEEITAISER